MNHLCHVSDCSQAVPPNMLMCRFHWNMVPKKMQEAVYNHYRYGQCDDKKPSKEWVLAASAARNHVNAQVRSIKSMEDRGEKGGE